MRAVQWALAALASCWLGLVFTYRRATLVAVAARGGVSVCYLADFHAAVDQYAGGSSLVDLETCKPHDVPLSKLTVIKHLLEPCDLRLFGGDLMHGSDYDHIAHGDRLTMNDIIRYWNIDGWTLGNHEFEGDGTINGVHSDTTEAPIVLSNIVLHSAAPLRRHLILRTPHAVFCVFGVIDPRLVDPSDAYTILPPVEAFLTAYEEVREQCGAVLLISHCGLRNDIAMLDALPPNVHVAAVLGAHTHNVLPDGFWRHSSGALLVHVGYSGGWVANLNYDPDLGVFTRGAREGTSYVVAPASLRGLPTVSEFDHDVRHGYLVETDSLSLTQWQPSAVKPVSVFSRKDFESLCATDHKLLAHHRYNILAGVRNLTSHVVATCDGAREEGYVTCRRGPCQMGTWLAESVRQSLLSVATSSVSLHCGATHLPKVTPAVALSAINAGVLRSQIPPDCDSWFERRSGGCANDRLDAYDIRKMLPFDNPVRVVALKNMDAVCRMLQRSLANWLGRRQSHPGLLHFGGLRYALSPQLYEGAFPVPFPALWGPVEIDELISVELERPAARGACVGRSLADDVIRWRCLSAECPENGPILLAVTNLLAEGKDGGTLKVAEDCVAAPAHVDLRNCTLDGLDATLRTSATRFLASVCGAF